MRLCFDIDGTIAELRSYGQSYEDVKPKQGAASTLRRLKNEGHYIILHTARGMESNKANMGKVLASQSKILFDWLEKHHILYDEVYFGKPSADVYIDDKGLKFDEWKNLKL